MGIRNALLFSAFSVILSAGCAVAPRAPQYDAELSRYQEMLVSTDVSPEARQFAREQILSLQSARERAEETDDKQRERDHQESMAMFAAIGVGLKTLAEGAKILL